MGKKKREIRLAIGGWIATLLICSLIWAGILIKQGAEREEAVAYWNHYHQLPLEICKDPNNYGLHSNGCREGMCYGFAINLLYRLQHETDVTAELWTFTGFEDPQPTAPKNPGENGMWGHAIVVFWTWWDNKMYACDENVGQAIEIDLNQVDWTCGQAENAAVLDAVMKQLWSHFPTRYPFAFNSFDLSAPVVMTGKADILKDFDPMAEDYFEMQAHAYYFPPDYCLD